MHRKADLEKLAKILKLSQYQRNILISNQDKYDMTGLIKRGDVLYAPHSLRTKSVFEILYRAFTGKSADLIGQDKMLLQGQRKIKFYAGGFHCVSVGQFKYYADPDGRAIPKHIFEQIVSANKR